MATERYIACPTRAPGETGQAFIDRMLAELNAKGRAAALPIPSNVVKYCFSNGRVPTSSRRPVNEGDGFVGGDANQWEPNLFRNTTQIYPFQGKAPGTWNRQLSRDVVRDARERLWGPSSRSSIECPPFKRDRNRQ